jgi:hypothetical protein
MGAEVPEKMNTRDIAELTALIDHINELVEQLVKETSPERAALLGAEINEASEKLKRMAFSFQN